MSRFCEFSGALHSGIDIAPISFRSGRLVIDGMQQELIIGGRGSRYL
jgi:hypothetical protein